MENRYKHSLSPVKIGNVEIKNRYALAPIGTGSMNGSRGEYTDNTIEYYLERDRGVFGLIVMCSIKAVSYTHIKITTRTVVYI